MQENIDFYHKMGPSELRVISEKVFVGDCNDLERISDLISSSLNVLEVGAGYGRVLDYLLKNFKSKKIIALENALSMFEYLSESYSGIVEVKNKSVLDFQISRGKPDLVLWMWSGFGDLSKKEQKQALGNLYPNTSKNVSIILDFPEIFGRSGKEGKVGSIKDNNVVTIDNKIFGHYEGYFPSKRELKEMAESKGYFLKRADTYSWNGSPRIQYLLKK